MKIQITNLEDQFCEANVFIKMQKSKHSGGHNIRTYPKESGGALVFCLQNRTHTHTSATCRSARACFIRMFWLTTILSLFIRGAINKPAVSRLRAYYRARITSTRILIQCSDIVGAGPQPAVRGLLISHPSPPARVCCVYSWKKGTRRRRGTTTRLLPAKRDKKCVQNFLCANQLLKM